MANPKSLKKGDKILILKASNGQQTVEKQILTVIKGYNEDGAHNCTAKDTSGRNWTFYNRGDLFCIAEKEVVLQHLKESLKDTKTEYDEKVKDLNSQIEYYEKYDSQEDYVAHKLENILSAHSSSGKKSNRIAAIKNILTTMRESNLI